jgi:hypothetical protein
MSKYCTIAFNSSVTHHTPSKIDEMSRVSRVPLSQWRIRWMKNVTNFSKIGPPWRKLRENFVLSRGYAATDETVSSDHWSHVTRGDGLNEMVQYGSLDGNDKICTSRSCETDKFRFWPKKFGRTPILALKITENSLIDCFWWVASRHVEKISMNMNGTV